MFETVHYYLQSKKIKSPMTLVMLADMHNHLYGENNQILLDEIKKSSPDLVCIAGDMLIGNSKIPYDVAQQTVVALAEKYQVFYGLGNHEARMKHDVDIYDTLYDQYMEPIIAKGVCILANESIQCRVGENDLCIYGYDLPMKYFEKFNRYPFEISQIEEVFGKGEEFANCFRILLAHNPVYFRQYAGWGADLTLSGHLHGGIIRLPLLGGVITPQAKLFPRYCSGKYTLDEKYMIVSRGLGTHTIPIRFNNKPELSVIHLEPIKTTEKWKNNGITS